MQENPPKGGRAHRSNSEAESQTKYTTRRSYPPPPTAEQYSCRYWVSPVFFWGGGGWGCNTSETSRPPPCKIIQVGFYIALNYTSQVQRRKSSSSSEYVLLVTLPHWCEGRRPSMHHSILPKRAKSLNQLVTSAPSPRLKMGWPGYVPAHPLDEFL